jgi:transitional endoplasmic reticulum ATPase
MQDPSPVNDPAIDALRAALAHTPDDVALRNILAQRLLARGRTDEAIAEYRACIRLEPQEPGWGLALGGVYLDHELFGAAELVAEELLRANAAFAPGHMLRARALAGGSKMVQAVKAYRVAVTIDPALKDEAFAVKLGLASTADESDESDEEPASSGAESGRATSAPAVEREDPAPDAVRPVAPRPSVESLYDADAVDPDARGLLEKPRIAFADVGGMEALKEEIRLKIIYPRLHSELYKAYDKKSGGGILFYGPPGCGKTFLSRATAGELEANFVSVGISDVLDMWTGSSERNLHRIFDVARSHAPSVLFFDEVDALAASRTDFKNSSSRLVINQFLSEMDGADASNEGVLVIGATNAPWHMDSAFRRPGRFDQIIFVPPPDEAARAVILEVMLRHKPADNVDVRKVAAATKDYSGADLMGLVNRAVETKIAEAIKDGIPRPLTTNDLMRAVTAATPTTREWFSTVRNYVLYQNEGGLYDPVRPYLKGR